MVISVDEIVTATGATTSVVFNKPAQATVGKYVLVILSWRSATTTMTPPSGWQTILSQDRGGTGQVFVVGRKMNSSEPSSWTFTQDSGSAGGALTGLVLSGMRNPALSIASSTVATNASAVTCPSVTSLISGLTIRAAIAANAATTTFTWGSGSEIADNALLPSGSSSYHAMAVNTATASGGSTGTNVATWSSSNGNIVGLTVVIADDRPKTSSVNWSANYQPPSSQWTGWGAQHSINSGQLQITLPASTSAYYSLLDNITRDLTDSYITVKLVQRTNQDTGSTETIWGAQIDANNAVQFLVAGTQLVCRERVGGVNSDSGAVTYSSSTHKYLRIRGSGTTIYWDTSSDGVSWTNRRNKTTTLNIGSCKIEYTAGAYNTSNTNPGSAIWDDLNLPSPAAAFMGS